MVGAGRALCAEAERANDEARWWKCYRKAGGGTMYGDEVEEEVDK